MFKEIFTKVKKTMKVVDWQEDIGSDSFLDILKGRQNISKWDVKVCGYYGYLDCLKYLHKQGYTFNPDRDQVQEYMLKGDQVNCLRYYTEHQLPETDVIMKKAILEGAYECVMYLSTIKKVTVEEFALACDWFFRKLNTPISSKLDKIIKYFYSLNSQIFKTHPEILDTAIVNSGFYSSPFAELFEDEFWRDVFLLSDVRKYPSIQEEMTIKYRKE